MRSFRFLCFGVSFFLSSMSLVQDGYTAPIQIYQPSAWVDTHSLLHQADYTHIADPKYNYMVRQLLSYIPDYFNFSSFRTLYTQTSFYDPFGVTPQQTMLDHAYTIKHNQDPEAVAQSLTAYHSTLQTHMANLGVVVQALSLARTDKRLGDADMLQTIKQGLFNSVLNSGDGTSLAGAYNITTMFEETMLISYLGFKIDDTQYEEKHRIMYNAHMGEYIREKEPALLFVDISLPMSHIKKSQNKKVDQPNINFKGQNQQE